MTDPALGRLAAAGVLERHGLTLRVAARFRAHLEATAARSGNPAAIVETALATWDPAVPASAAPALMAFLDDRLQWGLAHPVFAPLERFATVA